MSIIKNKEFNKKLISLVLPITFQQFMLALVSASDAIMLRNFNQNAMSAVSLAGQIQFIFNLFLEAMIIGTSILAAQYWGKKDKDSVERILGIVYRITLPVSLGFTLCTAIMPSLLMRIFTSETALIEYSADYLKTVSLSYLLCGISQIYLCIMKNSERAFKSSLISSACVVFNIILNAVFIFGLCGMPKLGVKGAALATVIARATEMIWSLSDSAGKNRVKIKKSYLIHKDKILHCDFWKYTTMVLCNEIVWGTAFSMGSVVIGHLGTEAVAANSIANIVKNLLVCFCLGVGTGGGIMIGNELGAGNLDKAKIYGGKLCRISIISGAVTGTILLCISPMIRKFVNLTPEADEYLKWMFVICSYYMIGRSVNTTTISGIFCAGGDSKFGFLCDTVVMWCIVVPLELLAAIVFKLPVIAVYFVISLDEMLKLFPVWKHYKKYLWVKNLTVK